MNISDDDIDAISVRLGMAPRGWSDVNAREIVRAVLDHFGTPDLLEFAESVVTLFAEAYPKAGLHLDMDKASLLNAARAAIAKAKAQP